MADFNKRDLDHLAEHIGTTYDRRKKHPRRVHLENQWAEVDRQVMVQAQLPIKRDSGATKGDWMPTLEMPNQAEAREILVKDASRLLFPRTEDWYAPCVAFTDELGKKLEGASLHPGDSGFTELGIANQETANIIVRAGLDYFHSQYNFRGAWDSILSDGIKYGSYGARLIKADVSVLTNSFRATQIKKVPFLVPVSIKNLYLDDSAQFVAQEGVVIQPSTIKVSWQIKGDLEKAARKGKGWFPKNIEALDPEGTEEKKGHVQLIQYEGDVFIPRSRGKNIFLENKIITLAVSGERKIIRIQDQEFAFRSYITGTYERDDSESPYGTSPLMRGRTLQEWASEAANRASAAAALNAEPPAVYDADDRHIVANGGVDISPGAQIEADNPGAVVPLKIGDPAALLAMFQGVDAMYQRVTKVNDPRRGGGPKSHSTAFAEDLNFSRGILPTEGFVNTIEDGPLTDFLYMEFEMGKTVIGNSLIAPVKIGGTLQHIEISRDLWPKRCDFQVFGSKGVLTKREELENTIRAYQTLAQTEQFVLQAGARPMDWDAWRLRIMNKSGISNADELLGTKPEETQDVEGGQGIPGAPPPA